MQKQSVAVIFGGCSSEHEVSRVSASMVINSIDKEKYEVHIIGIAKDGHWFLYEGDTALIKDGSWEQSGRCTPAFISPDRSVRGIIALRESGNEIIKLDAIFPAMHGKNGEDGTIQGLAELAGIPCVGCGCCSSAVCMDKAITHTLLGAAGIPQAKYVWFFAKEWESDKDELTEKIEKELGWPCFVKPANAGSSVGISKCSSKDELSAAVKKAIEQDSKVVVEEGIDGVECECAVFGNENPYVSTVGEIVPAAEWYDYDAKYNDEDSALFIPARLDADCVALIKKRAAQAYRVLGCAGLTRMDFFVRRSDKEVIINEPNTLPGFTPISMYPKLMEHDGVSNSELVDRLIQFAIAK